MEEAKEETKITITYDEKNERASVYLNDLEVDMETSIVMLCSHICLVIRNFMLDGASFPEAVEVVRKATKIACDRFAEELAEEEQDA